MKFIYVLAFAALGIVMANPGPIAGGESLAVRPYISPTLTVLTR
jgi:hypothetical protein